MRLALNACTAELVTEPVLVPSSAAFTLAIVAASTLNDASTSRIDWTCEAERPDAFAVVVVVVVVVTADVVTAGAVVTAGVLVTAAEPPPPPPDEVDAAGVDAGALPPLPVEEHRVDDGVIVTVTFVLG